MKSVLLSTAVVAFGLSMSACSSMNFDIDNVKFDDDVWAQEETVVVAAAAVAVGGYFLWDQTREWRAEREAAEREQQERIAYERGVALNAQRCAADPWTVRVVDEANFVYEYCDGSTRVNEELKAESDRQLQEAIDGISNDFIEFMEFTSSQSDYELWNKSAKAAIDLGFNSAIFRILDVCFPEQANADVADWQKIYNSVANKAGKAELDRFCKIYNEAVDVAGQFVYSYQGLPPVQIFAAVKPYNPYGLFSLN